MQNGLNMKAHKAERMFYDKGIAASMELALSVY